MDIKGWEYYSHAIIPTCAPHEKADLTPIENGTIWSAGKGALFARWISDFDCGYETDWWYVILDKPFDITSLKAKRRYEINKGRKNFDVKRIDPTEHEKELFEVYISAYSVYPEKYRQQINEMTFKSELSTWTSRIVYGGFGRESGKLYAYAILTEYDEYLEFSVLKAVPEMEHLAINAAMVAAIAEDYNERIKQGFYINDGSRAIRHETNFQAYLEKYFGFRKAYCKLNLKYRFPVNIIVSVLYPFRKLINKESKLGSQVYAVLLMHEISKSCKKAKD